MTETTAPLLKRHFHLRSHEVDRKGRAKPDVLFCFMLDSAWAHANNSRFSYDTLKAEGQLWVLSRFRAVFHKLPMWDDEIIVETWSKGTERMFGLRDFFIWSDKDEKLASATSAWLVIDRKTSRIQRIDLVNSDFPHQLNKNALTEKLEKLEIAQTTSTGSEYDVRYSDLDVNGHVNSSRYLEWILDSYPADILDSRNLKSFEMNFLAEALLGDRIRTASDLQTGGDYHEIKRTGDGTEVCRAITRWE